MSKTTKIGLLSILTLGSIRGYDDTRAALLEVIATELTKAAEGNSALISKTKRLLSRVDGFRAMGLLAEGTALMAGLPTGGLLSRGLVH